MKILTIKGLPSAGKTTISDHFDRSKNFKKIPEIASLLRRNEKFPGNGNMLNEVLKIDNWFIKKEAGVKTIGVATGNYSESQLQKAGADFVLRDLKRTEHILKNIIQI